jgi:peptide chain release factor 3
MDPKHRDRIAFIRVVLRCLRARHDRSSTRTGKHRSASPTLAEALRPGARDRRRGPPGDVIGLVGHDGFGIGDTLTEDRTIVYDEIPRFAPECFLHLHNPQPGNSKKFRARP